MHAQFCERIEIALASLQRRIERAQKPIDRGAAERQIGRLLGRNSRRRRGLMRSVSSTTKTCRLACGSNGRGAPNGTTGRVTAKAAMCCAPMCATGAPRRCGGPISSFPKRKRPFAVEGEVARARGFSVGFGWDDWRDRSSVEGGDEGVGVEGLVADQGAGIDGFDQRFGTSQIVILARAEHHLDGIAEGIDEPVKSWWSIRRGIGQWPARRLFLAPALCW